MRKSKRHDYTWEGVVMIQHRYTGTCTYPICVQNMFTVLSMFITVDFDEQWCFDSIPQRQTIS